MSISLLSRVQEIVDALAKGDIDPIVDPGDGKVYVLDINNREMGTLQYTIFDAETRFPEKSIAVKYGHQHIIHQALYASLTRSTLPGILTQEIPGLTRSDFDPMIVPALTQVYPTEVRANPDTSATNKKSRTFLSN